MVLFNKNNNKILFILGYVPMLLNQPYTKDPKGLVEAREAYQKAVRENPDFVFKEIPKNELHLIDSTTTFELRECIEGVFARARYKISADYIIEGSFKFYFLIGFTIFLIGFFGLIFLRQNLISLLLAIELMILGISFCFIVVNIDSPINYYYELKYLKEPFGYITALSFLSIAASESAIGLALIVLIFRQYKNLDVNNFGLLRG